MNKVNEMIRLLQEGNEEVKKFLTALSVDPEINIDFNGKDISLETPKDFDENLTKKIDDILERNK